MADKERKENKRLGCIMSKRHKCQLIFTKPEMEYDVFWTAISRCTFTFTNTGEASGVGLLNTFCLVWNDKA